MRELGSRQSTEFRRGRAGETIDAVALGEPLADGRVRLLTSHFVDLPATGRAEPGALVDVHLTWDGDLSGHIVGPTTWQPDASGC